MRKFTLFMLTAMMAVAVGAQPKIATKLQGQQTPAAVQLMKQTAARQQLCGTLMQRETLPVAAQVLKADAENVPVTPPADLETTRFRLNGSIQLEMWETVSRPIQIGFDGNDVYLQGFMYTLPEAWIKGTLNDDHTIVTFPMQFVGQVYNSNGDLRDLYFWPATYGTDESGNSGWQPTDAVFNYNEDMNTFVLTQDVVTYIFENTLVDGLRYFAVYDSQLTITDDSDTVEVPADLVTEDYQMDGIFMDLNDDNEWYEVEPFVRTVKVAFDDEYVYLQGLCPYISGAWVKGKRDGNKFVFENGQFFGTYIFEGEGYPIYLVGYEEPTDDAVEIVFELDEETGTLTTQQWVSLSAIPDDVLAFEVYSGVTLSHISDVAVVPAAPEFLYFEFDPELEMALAELDVPAVDVDGKPLITSKLSYQFFTDYGEGEEPYVFLADWHEGLEEDMTIVPYDFEDDIDFLRGGEMVLFYSIEEGIKRIGVKSIYTGGGQTNESPITWYLVDEDYDPTTSIASVSQHADEGQCFDLQGRRIMNGHAKGLVLQQKRTADGQVRTVKVVK